MKPQLVPYIAAEFRARDFDRYRSFFVGDGSRSSKVSEEISSRRKKRAQNTIEYYNGPLEENTFYAVFQRAYVNKVSIEGTPGLNTALSKCVSQIFLWKREDLEKLSKVSLKRSGTSQKLCIASVVGGLSGLLRLSLEDKRMRSWSVSTRWNKPFKCICFFCRMCTPQARGLNRLKLSFTLLPRVCEKCYFCYFFFTLTAIKKLDVVLFGLEHDLSVNTIKEIYILLKKKSVIAF